MSPENRSNEAREIAEQYLYDGDSDRPLNLGYYALLDAADSVAALESAHVAALARIAAVEAERDTMAETLRDIAEHGLWADLTPTMQFASMDQLYAQFSEYLRKLDAAVRERAAAALAASPTPTGPEPAKCEDCGWPWPLPGQPPAGAECDSCGGDLVPATPEPTEETP